MSPAAPLSPFPLFSPPNSHHNTYILYYVRKDLARDYTLYSGPCSISWSPLPFLPPCPVDGWCGFCQGARFIRSFLQRDPLFSLSLSPQSSTCTTHFYQPGALSRIFPLDSLASAKPDAQDSWWFVPLLWKAKKKTVHSVERSWSFQEYWYTCLYQRLFLGLSSMYLYFIYLSSTCFFFLFLIYKISWVLQGFFFLSLPLFTNIRQFRRFLSQDLAIAPDQ